MRLTANDNRHIALVLCQWLAPRNRPPWHKWTHSQLAAYWLPGTRSLRSPVEAICRWRIALKRPTTFDCSNTCLRAVQVSSFAGTSQSNSIRQDIHSDVHTKHTLSIGDV